MNGKDWKNNLHIMYIISKNSTERCYSSYSRKSEKLLKSRLFEGTVMGRPGDFGHAYSTIYLKFVFFLITYVYHFCIIFSEDNAEKKLIVPLW